MCCKLHTIHLWWFRYRFTVCQQFWGMSHVTINSCYNKMSLYGYIQLYSNIFIDTIRNIICTLYFWHYYHLQITLNATVCFSDVPIMVHLLRPRSLMTAMIVQLYWSTYQLLLIRFVSILFINAMITPCTVNLLLQT